MRKLRIAGTLAMLFVAGALAPPSFAQSPIGQDLTPVGRGAYVSVAGANDLYEIRSGEIALEKARAPQVRQFAGLMVEEHRRSTDRLLSGARSIGMEALPPAMMPFHWEMIRQLERRSGSRFDRTYVDQQVRAHEIALALHENYSRNGDAPALRAVAEAAVPMIRRHLAEARQLDR